LYRVRLLSKATNVPVLAAFRWLLSFRITLDRVSWSRFYKI
jgi:hypothetical protein